jgi:hypothetical protein
MKGITSAIDKQADEAAKANKAADLAKLIDESHEKLELDNTIANEDLTRIESWLWQYDEGHAAQPTPPPPPPPSEAPEPTNDASGAGSAAPAAEKATKADKSDKTEKAAQKAATEKADKKTAPDKRAAPKAGAGSGAK